jgi:hypothetical protein
VLRLRSDGTYEAHPAFGFHTNPDEERVGVKLRAGFANLVLRPDGTYDLEWL